ncbi:M16 family metallopeptidase [Krasilnikovia sp. MM14-A1259]|uniref:M16 family metallopeptidase n=1 Tax=Krasilnikovia sp. MM14-A1259 TaxID=3373539 RepID=UPI00381F3AA9
MTQTAPPVVAVVDERLTTTSICLAVAYGARHDPPGQGGLAHLLEHALMAAPVRAGASVTEYVERLGGHANAETGLELMLFYARVHADDADAVADRLLEAVLQPAFDPDLVRGERGVVLSELAAAEADPCDVVQDLFLARLFPGHPLGRPVGGSRAEVEALEPDDVARGHERVFRPAPMTMFVTGPRVPAPLAHAPAAPATGGAAADRGGAPAPLAGVPGDVEWPDRYAWAAIGARSTDLGDPDRHAYEILAQLLGGSPASMLYRALRNERGLAYSFQAWNRAYRDGGAWRVLVGVEPGNGDAILATVRDTLRRVAAGVEPDDMAAAYRQARMALIVGREDPLEHVRMMAQRSGAGTHVWTPSAELAALRAVTAEDVRRAAARILDDLVVAVWPQP